MVTNTNNFEPPTLDPVPKLGLSVDEAARAIGMGRRSLDDLIADPGSAFPVVRVGRRIIVPTDQLREWLRDQATAAPAQTT